MDLTENNKYDKVSIEETFKSLSTTSEGLTEDEAEERLKKFGPNTVRDEKENPLLKFLKKFWAPVPWMLEITAVITFLIGKAIDTYIIVTLLLFNSFIGFFQESKADNAVELLSQKLNVNSRVLRNGKWKQSPAACQLEIEKMLRD